VAVGDAPSATGAQWSSSRAVSVSNTGTLAYLGDRLPDTKLVWLDRAGRQTGTLTVPDGRYQEISIAPDGKRAIIGRYTTQSDADLWMADLVRGGATRFTTERALNMDTIWSPESDRIVFASDVAGPRDLFIKPASGATAEQPFYQSASLFKDTRAWSADGKTIVFEQLDPKTNRDLWMAAVDGATAAKPTPYLQTPFNEINADLSPDGKWLAYVSDEGGHNEVYIDAFPVARNKIKVTDQGAFYGYWSKDGRELMIVSADLKSVLVSEITIAGGTLNAGPPRKLFELPKPAVTLVGMRDHQRFLASMDVTDNTTSSLTLIFDWVGALKKK
jgi:Tol biopolymer transport system component